MKKFYGFYTLLFLMMFLIITGSASAFLDGNDKGVSSTIMSDGQQFPEGLSRTEWRKIQASIEQDRYQLYRNDPTGEYHAYNNAHNLDFIFSPDGFEVKPRKGKKEWGWTLRLSSYGYGKELHTVPSVEKVITTDNRIEYHREDMVEWYINDYRGLEQGITLKSQPIGHTGATPLELQMTSVTDLTPLTKEGGKGIIFRDSKNQEVLSYSGLYAYDATGKNLNCWMEADKKGIRLMVEDSEALYPIIIDPFVETKKLLASDGEAGDAFGVDVSISGDTVIVGAPGDYYYTGAAYIFYRNQGGADNWGEVKKLIPSDGYVQDFFGNSVSISGDTVSVGSYMDDDKGAFSGSAYIFSRNQGGTDNWGEVKKLLASDGTADDYFGYSVSIYGDTAIIGAYRDGNYTGSTYIFSRNQGGIDNWGEVKKLLASDYTVGDRYGYSVSISGDTAIVGAFLNDADVPEYQLGAAYIYSRDQGGTGNWGEVKKLTHSDQAIGDFFGESVSISGNTAIIGVKNDDVNGTSSGSAYIFYRDQGGANNWGEVKAIIASDGAASDFFGEYVSINGDIAIVAAPNDDDDGADSGSAYIFSRNQGGADNWGEVEKIIASDGVAGDRFGWSVSSSGETAIIGTYPPNTQTGSAYIFTNAIPKALPPVYLLLLDK